MSAARDSRSTGGAQSAGHSQSVGGAQRAGHGRPAGGDRRLARATGATTTGRPRVTVEVLAPSDVAAIHEATLHVLEHTGVFVDDGEALAIFADGGCVVDHDNRMVRMPPEVVSQILATCPPNVLLAGRDAEHDVLVTAGGGVSFTNFDEGISYVDPRSGELREPTEADVRDVARLVDAMPHIDTYEAAIGPADVPAATASIHGCAAALQNTLKQVGVEAVDRREVRACIALAAQVVGSVDNLHERPIIGFGVCPVSPLKLTADVCGVIIESARAGLSDTILSMAMAGGSSPVTLAGTLVQHNAEVLAGIALAQLTEPGAPVIYGSSTTAMDLRYASASVGSPELALISACAAQLARQYRLPSYIAGA
jgi:trimethylamine--corrinoid protein Co-methyltransferase